MDDETHATEAGIRRIDQVGCTEESDRKRYDGAEYAGQNQDVVDESNQSETAGLVGVQHRRQGAVIDLSIRGLDCSHGEVAPCQHGVGGQAFEEIRFLYLDVAEECRDSPFFPAVAQQVIADAAYPQQEQGNDGAVNDNAGIGELIFGVKRIEKVKVESPDDITALAMMVN